MKKSFVYKCKLSLSLALFYLVDLFINELKTKFNNLFYRLILNTKRVHNSFWRNFPARSEQTPSKVLFVQGSKLKKSSGRLLATNWRNIVAKCKFLVASLCNGNDAAHSQGFWYFATSQSSEIHKNMQNTGKFGRNLIKYMSVQHIWNFSHLLGLFTCRKLVNLSWNFVTETCKECKQRP